MNTYTVHSQDFPSVTSGADGSFVVVWEGMGQDGDHWGVFGRRYDSGGAAVGAEFQVNTYTAGFQGFPVVASDDSGDFVVVWVSIQGGTGTDVFAARFSSTPPPTDTPTPTATITATATDTPT